MKAMLRRLAFIAPLIPAAGVAYAYMGRGSRNKFEYGGKMIPHPEKTAKGGEDAYYASKHVLAVADGVGGWNEVGVDPALYSRKLCKNIEGIIASNPTGLLKDPKTIITKAWMDNTEQGSSTLVVITLPEDEPRIYTSYVGDSGYCVLRPDNPLTPKTFSVLYASEPQQRRFNYPMQLGWGRNGDHPSIALTYSHDIQDGDIIIVGTDGLFDNISPKNISTVVSDFHIEQPYDGERLAAKIAKRAYKHSLDKNYKSPFSLEAERSGILYRGGKSDDITVITARIRLDPSDQNRLENKDK